VTSPPIKLIAFDIDGTLVHHERHETVWQVLNARYLPRAGLNRERFDAYRNRTITYAEWVDLDIGDWVARAVTKRELQEAMLAELSLAPGAIETIELLRGRGYRLVVLSGTLNLTLELFLPDTEFDDVFTNQIWFHPDGTIRRWQATPFDVDGKAVALASLSRAHGWELSECAFVGDGWNDIPVLSTAGFSVAFHPKLDEVRQAADVAIESGPVTRLLELFPGVVR
jgi:phosphoserine phosphatase